MESVILPIALGIFIVILGVLNMRGHISSIHWYHRRRVSAQDVLPFGKRMGLGTIIIGVCVSLFGILSLVAEMLNMEVFVIAGSVIAGVGCVAGIAVSLYAMMKYNKGIF